jgi:Tol biopolymer transport system component
LAPVWFLEGDRIAFTSDGTEGPGEIYVMDSDGSGLTKLTDDPADDSSPPGGHKTPTTRFGERS